MARNDHDGRSLEERLASLDAMSSEATRPSAVPSAVPPAQAAEPASPPAEEPGKDLGSSSSPPAPAPASASDEPGEGAPENADRPEQPAAAPGAPAADAGDQPSGDQPSEEQGEQASGDRPSGEPSGEQPSGEGQDPNPWAPPAPPPFQGGPPPPPAAPGQENFAPPAEGAFPPSPPPVPPGFSPTYNDFNAPPAPPVQGPPPFDPGQGAGAPPQPYDGSPMPQPFDGGMLPPPYAHTFQQPDQGAQGAQQGPQAQDSPQGSEQESGSPQAPQPSQEAQPPQAPQGPQPPQPPFGEQQSQPPAFDGPPQPPFPAPPAPPAPPAAPPESGARPFDQSQPPGAPPLDQLPPFPSEQAAPPQPAEGAPMGFPPPPPAGFPQPPHGYGPAPEQPMPPAEGYAPGAPQPPVAQPPGGYPQGPAPLHPQQVPGHGYPAQPPQQQPQPQPQNADALSSENLLGERRIPPSSGWRRAIYKATGGSVHPGESQSELRRKDLVARARQPVAGGHHRVAVMSLKGGVGKTTTTVGLGSMLASLRGDRVIAVDANPDRGTLSDKVKLETAATVRDLLNNRENIHRYADVRAFTSQNGARLEVLASDRDPAVSEAFSADDYSAVAVILEQYYSICITDCGTGLLHSAMAGVLALADQLVLVSSPSVDGARSASATLDWLEAHDHGHLVRSGVVVLSMVRHRTRSQVDLDKLQAHFESRCRAVVRIPYDDHLEEGAEVELEALAPGTREAYLKLAAVVGDGLSQPRMR